MKNRYIDVVRVPLSFLNLTSKGYFLYFQKLYLLLTAGR